MFDTSLPGPFYEDFRTGATLPPLPSVTLTEADNAMYRAVTGDQHALAADRLRAAAITGNDDGVVNPGLVMQYSVGQTTMATRQAIANLYYLSVRMLRPVRLGATLETTTKVLGLKDSSPKGDVHRGKVWLGIVTSDADGPVIEYQRVALIRGSASPGRADDLPGPSGPTPLAELLAHVPNWDLSTLNPTVWEVGATKTDPLRDHIDLAAPLARLTFNQAAVHRDFTTATTGERLVYGGHVQGLAQASLTRMLPGLTSVLAWDGCDHTGPAFEGDLIEFRHELTERSDAGSGSMMRFTVTGTKIADRNGLLESPVEILVWTPVVWGT